MKKIFLLITMLVLFGVKLDVKAVVVDDLNKQLEEKQATIKNLEEQINIYKKNIEVKQNESLTLNNQLSILKSKIIKMELDIKLVEAQMDSLDFEISSLNKIIEEKRLKIEKQKVYVANILRLVNIEDMKDYLTIIFKNESFSEYFNQTKYLEDMNSELNRVIKQIKAEKTKMESKERIAETKKNQLEKLKKDLLNRKASLDEQKESKNYLLAQTKSSENKFKLLLIQLRQEQSAFDQEISSLQRKIEKELKKANKLEEFLGEFSWPINAYKGISVYFRDPTYPFRYLFEHSGIDMPTSMGTPVKAAAAGFVAWTRSSNRAYGNNIMIIHGEGAATLYAHLSRFNVLEGDFVKRGDIIAYSGGLPGTPGAGFSTGPHLHFEVRENGLPVDPMGYLK